jgi:hypothetical protein
LRPSSFVMCNTPVEVQFTSAGCLNYPCRTQAWFAMAAGQAAQMIAHRVSGILFAHCENRLS